eukprot:4854845-Prymnesium_polylepis.1
MCVRGARGCKSDANSFGWYHAPPAPSTSTTARACLNALTAHGELRIGFARRWCVVGVQHVDLRSRER